METTGALSVDAILEVLEAVQPHDEAPPGEGLRDRKKRRLRQRISDVATAMFLVEGFDDVSVVRIAQACEVSEKTVFNYFPTKESLFFDRNESAAVELADAIRNRGDEPLGDVVMNAIVGDNLPHGWGDHDEAVVLRLFRRFCEVAQSSATLRSAPYIELPAFLATVGAALADRIGVETDDPEVILVSLVIAGLILVRTEATRSHVQRARSIAALDVTVRADTLRAIAIAGPTLAAFDDRQPPAIT